MSDIVGELRRGHEAFKKPTLDLLRRKHAPVLLADPPTEAKRHRERLADKMAVRRQAMAVFKTGANGTEMRHIPKEAL